MNGAGMEPTERIVARVMADLRREESHIAEPGNAAIQLAVTKGRRRRTVQRLGVGALILGLAVGIVVPLALLLPLTPTGNHTEPGASRNALAVHLAHVPNGWSLVERQNPLGAHVIAANHSIPSEPVSASALVSNNPRGGIVVSIQQVTSGCPCTGFTDSSLPLRLSPEDIQTIGGYAHFLSAVRVGSEYLVVYGAFGRSSVGAGQLAQLNQALARLTFAAKPSTSGTDVSGAAAPPTFSDPMLNVASTASYSGSESTPITWASDFPFAGSDIAPVAEYGTLAFRPESSLAHLPQDGFIIIASYVEPDPTTPPGPNDNFPPRSLPLKLDDAEVRLSWEGQLSPSIPEYVIWAYVDGHLLDVRVYFGSLHPSAEASAAAQEALNSMRLG